MSMPLFAGFTGLTLQYKVTRQWDLVQHIYWLTCTVNFATCETGPVFWLNGCHLSGLEIRKSNCYLQDSCCYCNMSPTCSTGTFWLKWKASIDLQWNLKKPVYSSFFRSWTLPWRSQLGLHMPEDPDWRYPLTLTFGAPWEPPHQPFAHPVL